MDSERWRRVDSLLQAALERPPDERAEFLKRACGGDRDLEREVESLVVARQEAGSFLERPAVEVAARGMALQQDADSAVSLTGQTISHYRILEKLGAGGMGVVWKASDPRLNRLVAIKVLPADKMASADRKQRFVQEARAASALNHPNIITIHDIAAADGIDFIVMEYVAGATLERRIPKHGMRLDEVVEIAIQIADGLAKAHAAGIVHRDIKPGNIIVNEEGRVKLLDFGLAKLTERAPVHGEEDATRTVQALTESGVIVGTMAYMSPEQAEAKTVDARSDIFSFGAVLYEMITGRRAFQGGSMLSILSAILRVEPQPAAEIVHGLPRELDRIVRRCLRKDPNRRYQHAGDLKIDLEQVKEALAAGGSAIQEEMPARRSARRWWWAGAAAAACVGIALGVAWWVRRPPPAAFDWRITRLTADAGLATSPGLSSDGKLLAYASDGGRDGGLDLYVKQAAGGQPIRLTSDGADNRQPDFSPDGSKIVFRSNRGGVPGIYAIPAFGGEVRLLARDGFRPRFSPDGSQVAYWAGSERQVYTAPGTAVLWVIAASGGQPQRVRTNCTAARAPIWSPDGKHLLFVGYTSTKLYDDSKLDWWLAKPDGSEPIQTGAYDALQYAGLRASSFPLPCCWSIDSNTVRFSARTGDAVNIWEIGLSARTGKVTGVPRRLTLGAGTEDEVSCASGGALAFSDRESRGNVWLLPFDLNRGTPAGAPERATQGPANRGFPSLTKDGRWVAFFSDQSGPTNIWRRDLASGNESIVASSSLGQRYPVISPSGARIAFGVNEKDGKRTVYVTGAGAEPEKVCEGCTRATDWSSDEKSLLIYGGTPFQVHFLDVATHEQTPLLKHPTYGLLYGHFSPDGRWVSFTIRTSPNHARFAIAPLDGPRPIPESAWITIADGWIEDWANWSPDGKTLYFPSGRDGHRCLWGQRIDAVSHRPAGEPFAAWHFHGRGFYEQDGWSTAAGRIAIVLREDTGNIWLMSRRTAD